jgi:hypothetical protein
MKTDALIDRLAEGVPPVSPNAAPRALMLGLSAGALVSFALMLAWLGLRPDLAHAVATEAYWIKFAYTLAFALFGVWTLERLSRPGAAWSAQALLELVPFALVVLLAVLEWRDAAPEEHRRLLMGASANVCPWRILILALPVFAGTFWGLRRLAPTRPMLAGAAAGLAAGALGAWIYAFHCDESAAPFVALWYTLGIAAVGAAGAALGRFLLRW